MPFLTDTSAALEVTYGVVVAFGTVDDGLGGGIPGDFLEGEGMA